MAIYHLSATAVQRSKGHSAVAGAAYRSGSTLHEVMTNQTHDYQRKRGIVRSEIMAPDNAPDWTHDREELWNRAELAEKRRDAQPAREIRLGLPHELDDGQRADLVFRYAQDMFVAQGMVADISIHRPDHHGDQRNYHAHILLTMRELDGDNFSTKKQRDWNRTELLEYWREEWAHYQNDALEVAGFDERVDHRSFEAQGSNHEPTRHLGKDASVMEREGKASRIGDENREVKKHNRELDELVNELAAVQAEISRELEITFLPAEPESDVIVSLPVARIEEPLSWEEQKRRSQNLFTSEVTQEFESQIRERGEISEYGLGKSWFDRTLTMFENFYYDVREQAKDVWRIYVVDRFRDKGNDHDKDIEPER
jgi:hypothetical protein